MKKEKVKRARKPKVEFTDEQLKTVGQTVDSHIENIKYLENAKLISINDLPECEHKKKLLPIVQDASKAEILIVASINGNKWEALAGYPDVRTIKPNTIIGDNLAYDWEWLFENIRDHEQVMMMGEKLDKDTALLLFPDFKVLSYGE